MKSVFNKKIKYWFNKKMKSWFNKKMTFEQNESTRNVWLICACSSSWVRHFALGFSLQSLTWLTFLKNGHREVSNQQRSAWTADAILLH